MKKTVPVIFVLLSISLDVKAQDAKQIELTPYFKWDSYPKFVYSVNPVNSNTVFIKGKSWGINAAYQFPINNLFLKAGLGFFKYNFDKIEQTNSFLGKSESRIINYVPDGILAPSIIYNTNKYWYNTIAVSIGIEKPIIVTNALKIISGIDLNNYFTFSQYYHITYPRPEGSNFKLTNKRYFGISANVFGGLRKSFNKISIGPTVIVPIFSLWKRDKIFPQETNGESRLKWLKGVGVGITW